MRKPGPEDYDYLPPEEARARYWRELQFYEQREKELQEKRQKEKREREFRERRQKEFEKGKKSQDSGCLSFLFIACVATAIFTNTSAFDHRHELRKTPVGDGSITSLSNEQTVARGAKGVYAISQGNLVFCLDRTNECHFISRKFRVTRTSWQKENALVSWQDNYFQLIKDGEIAFSDETE